MDVLNFDAFSLPLLIAIYAAAAAVVWFAGSKATRFADEVSRRTGIGGAAIGMVMLGAMTSLPEISTSTTAAIDGNATLAVTSLLGGVSFQIVSLAIVDMAIGDKAITSTVPNPSILLQGIISVLLLAMATAGAVSGDFSVLGVGVWSTGMLLVYAASIVFVRDQERDADWLPEWPGGAPRPRAEVEEDKAAAADDTGPDPLAGKRLIVAIAVSALAILAAGYVLTRTAESIATRTGIESSIAGMTLLAVATSLPELSTAIAAVRLGRNAMAIGDVLGGNLFDLMLIFFVDLIYPGPPVLGLIGPLASFGALLAIILTSFYLVGMIERNNRTILRMGYDSLLVLIFYAGGLGLIVRAAIVGTG